MVSEGGSCYSGSGLKLCHLEWELNHLIMQVFETLQMQLDLMDPILISKS